MKNVPTDFQSRLRYAIYVWNGFDSFIAADEACRLPKNQMRQYAFENGSKPGFNNLKKICTGLCVSADWLLGLTDEIKPPAPSRTGQAEMKGHI